MLTNLNEKQKSAAMTIDGGLLVLAGAGTGKTKVITSRIGWMISNGVNPESIVALSFTNKAAKEMQERLCTLIGEKQSQRVVLSTFHAFALRLLREYGHKVGIPKNFLIAAESQSQSFLKEALKELELEEMITFTKACEKMSFYKDYLYQDEDFKKSKHIFERNVLGKLFSVYNRKLRVFNFLDFNDIVYLATLMLMKNSEIKEKIRKKYQYFLIDEYQDTSFSQFRFICLVSEPLGNVCAVGDDDQSIYSWRGAKPSIIFDFIKEFQNAKQITLDQNYRSNGQILSAANDVIRENTERFGKELWTTKSGENAVNVRHCEHPYEEAEFIAQTILSLQKSTANFHYYDVAVLYRSSSLLHVIQENFQKKEIPYTLPKSKKMFDKKEVKDFLSYLRFAVNKNDSRSLFRILSLASPQVNVSTFEKINDLFLKNKDMLDTLQILSVEDPAIKNFIDMWSCHGVPLEEACGIENILSALSNCYEKMGLKKDILLNSSNMKVAQYRLNAVQKIMGVMKNSNAEIKSLVDLNDSFFIDEMLFDGHPEREDKVQMMTIHASKGLEFPFVFVVGVEEGILPHGKSLKIEHGEQEERRLFYVAMTRAKEKLYISHCERRDKGKSYQEECTQSRFLDPILKNKECVIVNNSAEENEKKLVVAKKLFDLFKTEASS